MASLNRDSRKRIRSQRKRRKQMNKKRKSSRLRLSLKTSTRNTLLRKVSKTRRIRINRKTTRMLPRRPGKRLFKEKKPRLQSALSLSRNCERKTRQNRVKRNR